MILKSYRKSSALRDWQLETTVHFSAIHPSIHNASTHNAVGHATSPSSFPLLHPSSTLPLPAHPPPPSPATVNHHHTIPSRIPRRSRPRQQSRPRPRQTPRRQTRRHRARGAGNHHLPPTRHALVPRRERGDGTGPYDLRQGKRICVFLQGSVARGGVPGCGQGGREGWERSPVAEIHWDCF